MMPNDNTKVVRQHKMVVDWVRVRQIKKLKETNQTVNLPHKNSKLFLIKILVIMKIIKLILTVKVIMMMMIIIIIIIISKSSEKPDIEESMRFWSNIWGTEKSHK